MEKPIIVPHGLFYMENAGGYKPADTDIAQPLAAEGHLPSCFALEEKSAAKVGAATAQWAQPLMKRCLACSLVWMASVVTCTIRTSTEKKLLSIESLLRWLKMRRPSRNSWN